MDRHRFRDKSYKIKYLCFDCRKVFKRLVLSDLDPAKVTREDEAPAKCPQCGTLMTETGSKLRVPVSHDKKAWEVLRLLNEFGESSMHGHLYSSTDGPLTLPGGPVTTLKRLKEAVAFYEANQIKLMNAPAKLRGDSMKYYGEWLTRAKRLLRS